MAKQSFDPNGVSAKQAELYQLSNADLLTQANLIRSNLVSWVNNNFTLDNSQQAFLNSADARWIQYTAQVTGFAVENRLGISLAKKGTGSGKLIKTIGTGLECDFSNTTGFAAKGTLVFEVDYS